MSGFDFSFPARGRDPADRVEGLVDRPGPPKRPGPPGLTGEYPPGAVKRGLGGSTAWNPGPLPEEDRLNIRRGLF